MGVPFNGPDVFNRTYDINDYIYPKDTAEITRAIDTRFKKDSIN